MTSVHSEAPRHPIPTPSRFKVNTRKVEAALSIKSGQVVGAVLMTIKFLEKKKTTTTTRQTLKIMEISGNVAQKKMMIEAVNMQSRVIREYLRPYFMAEKGGIGGVGTLRFP